MAGTHVRAKHSHLDLKQRKREEETRVPQSLSRVQPQWSKDLSLDPKSKSQGPLLVLEVVYQSSESQQYLPAAPPKGPDLECMDLYQTNYTPKL
jgi:hypothetical protein